MNYVIELITHDTEGCECKEYFKDVYADDFGIVRFVTTENPLAAKMFATVEPENRNSILKVIRNVCNEARIEVKELEYNLK